MSGRVYVETKRCILREMEARDSKFWFEFMTDQLVSRYLPDRIGSEPEMADILNWLTGNYRMDPRNAIRITLSISLTSTPDRPIGWVTYGPLPENERLREIGYAVAPEYWGKGYATEAAKGFLDWIVHVASPKRLYATVDISNGASIRVLEKLGMKRVEGHEEAGLQPSEHHQLYEMELPSN